MNARQRKKRAKALKLKEDLCRCLLDIMMLELKKGDVPAPFFRAKIYIK